MLRFRQSRIGQALTLARLWDIRLADGHLVVEYDGRSRLVPIESADEITVEEGLIWPWVHVKGIDAPLRVMRRRDAQRLTIEFERLTTTIRLRAPVQEAREASDTFQTFRTDLGRRSLWFTEEHIRAAETAQARLRIRTIAWTADCDEYVAKLSEDVQKAVTWALTGDIREIATFHNQRVTKRELRERDTFFKTVEKSPLTREQSKAVICFDNRVEVIAAAGSGKTSTMVAKAGYTIMRGLVSPERILMLAFNANAADELKVRTKERLEAAGIDAEGLRTSTFHSFGLSVIGQATGAKPRLAPELEHQNGLSLLAEIVHELRMDPHFNEKWLMFRAVYGPPVPPPGEPEPDPDTYESGNPSARFQTMGGPAVKSTGERRIANWLIANGIDFTYERPYEHPTATADHGQYHPDFYYPAANAYHEHWAFVRPDRLPAKFAGYHESTDWKRELHRHHGTDLIETKAAEIADDTALNKLREALRRRGVIAQPQTEVIDRLPTPLTDKDLLSLLRVFLVHAKSNRLSGPELMARITKRDARERRFLDIFIPVRAAWDAHLAATNTVDFDDMLNHATDLIEQGRYVSPYDLVMVDEFQDTSHARAALVRALVARPGKHLFAVGDDWQSIYRFAGSDISAMTEFEAFYGRGHVLRLQETFRSPQRISDVAAAFISKNPKQLTKTVTGPPEPTDPPHVIIAENDDDMRRAAHEVLGTLPPEDQVLVLGRYNSDEDYAPKAPNVQFLTIHRAKGLEADHVIIVNVTKNAFPSAKEDDRLLQLAMPAGDTFEFAEERRLFYVALTRARKSVTLITAAGRQSAFLRELIDAGQVTVEGDDAAAAPCPTCDSGFLVERTGPYGTFYGCNRFPACRGTAQHLAVSSRSSDATRSIRRPTHSQFEGTDPSVPNIR